MSGRRWPSITLFLLLLKIMRLLRVYRQLEGFRFPQSRLRRACIDSSVSLAVSIGEVVGGLLQPSLTINTVSSWLSVSRRGIAYAGRDSCAADVFFPPDATHTAPVLFVHGGAWAWGHRGYYSAMCRHLCDALKTPVVNVGYRLYPETDIKGQIQDVSDAARWAAIEFGAAPILVGHSAGGHLASASQVCVDPASRVAVAAVCGIAAPYDIASHYVHESRRKITAFGVTLIDGVHRISPMAPAAGGHDGFASVSPLPCCEDAVGDLPPHVLIHGASDTTVPLSSSQNMDEALTRKGYESKLVTVEGGHTDMILDCVVPGVLFSPLVRELESLLEPTAP